MAYSLNKVTLIGQLGQDPTTRQSNAGHPITSFSIATNRRWRDQQTQENREETEWHNIICFGRLAEIAAQYLQKGSQCFIEGELRTNSWERDGVRHQRTEIRASDLGLLGGSRNSSNQGYSQSPPKSGHQRPNTGKGGSSNPGNPRSQTTHAPPPQDNVGNDLSNTDIDDDIPF